jgi:hypothetical protein
MKRQEQALQRAVINHLAVRGVPGLVYFHPANGGWRSPIEARIMKGLGVKAGVSDLILLHKGRFVALELKAISGRLSAAQRQFLEDVEAAGGHALVAVGLDEALATLEDWGFVKGKVT